MLKNHFRLMAPEGEAGSAGGVAVNAEIMDNVDPNETFDNLEYESEASKKAGEAFQDRFKERIEKAKKAKEDLSKDDEKEEKARRETKKGKDIDLVKSEDEEMDLDGKAVKKEEKKEEKKDEVDAKDEKKVEEKAKSDEEKVGDDKAKKLKIRMSDGLYGIEPDAKVRVKIDGEFQEVPVQELINQYSGKVAYDKKFTEIGNEKKQLEYVKKEVEKTQTFLKETVNEVITRMDDPEKGISDAMLFLVEKAGKDPFEYWKRNIEANLEEVEKLMSMSEVERKAYFLEKKDEFRSKAEKARMEAYTKEQAFNQALAKVDALRQAHGVSEEQYLQALDELEAEGVDTSKWSDEKVVDYASLKPHVTTVQDILEPYEANIDDSKYPEIVQNLARQIRAKSLTAEQLKEIAKKEFVDEDIKDLQSRTSEPQKKSTRQEVKAPEKIETLDWD